MIYIAIGCSGFLLIHLFDIVALKKLPLAKPITWVLGSILLAYALVMLCLSPDKFYLPAWVIPLGWVTFIISLVLLLFSLFINLPFRKTYINSGTDDKLIKSGLYALVRHPGVHWFTLLMAAMVLISQSTAMLTAAPVFILLDVILVIVQDIFFFGKMFTGYDAYRKETPMLLPNRKSVQAFIASLKEVHA